MKRKLHDFNEHPVGPDEASDDDDDETLANSAIVQYADISCRVLEEICGGAIEQTVLPLATDPSLTLTMYAAASDREDILRETAQAMWHSTFDDRWCREWSLSSHLLYETVRVNAIWSCYSITLTMTPLSY
jgi:hypothetical protein